MPVAEKLEDYIAARVDRGGDCHLWTGYVNDAGYGIVNCGDLYQARAHRVVWEQERGPIPEGAQIDHLCRNRRCVRPDHLEPVTQQENIERGLVNRLRNGMDSKCVNGHEYTSENTYHPPSGKPYYRQCRECNRIRARKNHYRKKNNLG